MKSFVISIGQRKYKIKAEKINGEVWIHCDGQTFVSQKIIQQKKSSSQSSRGSKTNSGEIFAPMPGKIIKVLKQQGEKIKENTTIVVMEAMKMEYSLDAALSGVLKELNCIEGDQVSQGQILAVVIPEMDSV